ncbi:hypothetical protein AUK40_02275 [Candidatus Wirthbacteria bacterium CG2_30_54_11]|uniref:Uncharacterized protein n=1 Tax=Candidatus Wirthbacteria bacterium CG2_30_54_11 TaxID=1817892 RepID=A0A1J5J332_9BACT|nr:MAG: hypothetical protein AUK40_02275 [Candidatus Wirthbacteria bacterium CG2_30_54_11]
MKKTILFRNTVLGIAMLALTAVTLYTIAQKQQHTDAGKNEPDTTPVSSPVSEPISQPISDDRLPASSISIPLCEDKYVLPSNQRTDWQTIEDSAIQATIYLPPNWYYEKSQNFSGIDGYDGYRIASYDIPNTPGPDGHPQSALYVPENETVLGFSFSGNDKMNDESSLQYLQRKTLPQTPLHDPGHLVLWDRDIAYEKDEWQFEYTIVNGNNAYTFFGYNPFTAEDQVNLIPDWEDKLTTICTILSSIELQQIEPLPISDSPTN